jgi:hypothetical protein
MSYVTVPHLRLHRATGNRGIRDLGVLVPVPCVVILQALSLLVKSHIRLDICFLMVQFTVLTYCLCLITYYVLRITCNYLQRSAHVVLHAQILFKVMHRLICTD